ncbi:hypothetical protein [Actinospica robiniae]|uniref:hypothetical protein n=1 Tax=Actinospica robiniae TaxID=304901 RepID=UPI0003F585CB|nr:hypothetical protein [Actinospica robiniae]
MSGSEPADASDRTAAGSAQTGSEASPTPESVETIGTAAASGSADTWASPTAAPTADAAAPTMAVPLAQPQFSQAPNGPIPPQQMPPNQPFYAGYGQPYMYQPSPEEIQAAQAAAKHKRKRRLWTSAAVVAVVALVGGGVTVYATERHGNSKVSAVTCAPAKLSSCLILQPAGAEQLTDSPKWDQTTVPTTSTFGANMTADAKGMADQTSLIVDTDVTNALAHTDWNAVDGDDVDMVLLKFDTIEGAQSWNATRNGEILAAYPGQSVAIPGDSAEKAHAATKADAKGNFHAAYSAVVGDIVLNLSYSSPNSFDPADLENWAGTELSSLWSAPTPPKDPADSGGNGTQTLSCASLAVCLPKAPSGFEPWIDAPKGWPRGSILTPKQYVGYAYLASDVSAVEDNFSTYNVTGVGHADWSNDSGYQQADIYLIQTLTETGAQTLYGDNFGEPNWSDGQKGISYTIPGESDAQAWYTDRKDGNGFIELFFSARIGNTIVQAWTWFYGSLNKSVANKWASSTIDKVKATSSQQQIGQPSLNAPAVKTPAQGSCSASGDCLMALPAGSTDTTSGSTVAGNKAVTAMEYSTGFEGAFGMQYNTWLTADGFQSAEHRAWSSGGAKAEGALVKFGSPAQAQAAAMLEYGLGSENGRICTLSSATNAFCTASAVSVADYYAMETVTVTAWKGDYEVRVQVTASNQAEVAQAYAWAEQQLAMLPAS